MDCISLESDPIILRMKEALGSSMRSMLKYLPNGMIMSEQFGEVKDKIKNMPVRPDDVWIVTFPKTGTTVLQEACWLLKNNLNYEKAKEMTLTDRAPYLEASTLDLPDSFFPGIDTFENLQSPRLIKTHLPLSFLPDALWTIRPKVITSYRNPKDVVISYFHHSELFGHFDSSNKSSVSFEEFTEWFLADRTLYSPFWPMILEGWTKRDEPNCLFVRFDDIAQDPPKFLRQLTDFLQESLTVDEEEGLLQHLSFDRMQSNPSVNYEKVVRQNSKRPKGKFVRSGKVDEWRSRLSPETIKRFDEWSARFLNNSDFPLYY